MGGLPLGDKLPHLLVASRMGNDQCHPRALPSFGVGRYDRKQFHSPLARSVGYGLLIGDSIQNGLTLTFTKKALGQLSSSLRNSKGYLNAFYIVPKHTLS